MLDACLQVTLQTVNVRVISADDVMMLFLCPLLLVDYHTQEQRSTAGQERPESTRIGIKAASAYVFTLPCALLTFLAKVATKDATERTREGRK